MIYALEMVKKCEKTILLGVLVLCLPRAIIQSKVQRNAGRNTLLNNGNAFVQCLKAGQALEQAARRSG